MSATDCIKLDIPKQFVVEAILDQLNRIGVAAPLTQRKTLPAIGEAFEGGIYAGVTLHNDAPHALVAQQRRQRRADEGGISKITKITGSSHG